MPKLHLFYSTTLILGLGMRLKWSSCQREGQPLGNHSWAYPQVPAESLGTVILFYCPVRPRLVSQATQYSKKILDFVLRRTWIQMLCDLG